MSMPCYSERTCSICGKKSKQIELMSSNSMGYADLDLRPPEMMRSTMRWWIQECPQCGYVSDNLENTTSVDRKWLENDSFKSTYGLKFLSYLASMFYKHYLISLADENHEDAFYAALRAAWSCDDADDIENAETCRKAALEQIDILIDKQTDDAVAENFRVLRMDLLRRSKQFSRVIEEYSGVEFSADFLNRIKAFQIALSQQNDAECYTLGECGE